MTDEEESTYAAMRRLGFHAKDDVYFFRMDEGAVRITVDQPPVKVVVELDAASWASVVAAVSARGESAYTFAEATRLHLGERRTPEQMRAAGEKVPGSPRWAF